VTAPNTLTTTITKYFLSFKPRKHNSWNNFYFSLLCFRYKNFSFKTITRNKNVRYCDWERKCWWQQHWKWEEQHQEETHDPNWPARRIAPLFGNILNIFRLLYYSTAWVKVCNPSDWVTFLGQIWLFLKQTTFLRTLGH